MHEENYRAFGLAIVKQALQDYERALKGERIDGRNPGFVKGRVRKFLRSDWFQTLCDLDPEEIIEKMEAMHSAKKTRKTKKGKGKDRAQAR